MKNQLACNNDQLNYASFFGFPSYLLTFYQSKFILQNKLPALKPLSQALFLGGYCEPKLRYFVSL